MCKWISIRVVGKSNALEGHGPKLTPPDVVWIMRDVSAQTPAKAKKAAQLRAAISIAAI